MPDAETSARTAGDIARGRLAPMVGGLCAGVLALELGQHGLSERVSRYARAMLAGGGDPGEALHEALMLVDASAPILAAVLAGALLVGALQTRGYLGGLGPIVRHESPVPALPLALTGWVVLAVALLANLKLLLQLGIGTAPQRLAEASWLIATRAAHAALLVVAAAALVDHLVRARARRARLEPAMPPFRAPAAATEAPTDRVEGVLDAAMLVVHEAGLALAIGDRDGHAILIGRARGLGARALADGARRRGVRVRAATDLLALETVPLGAPLPPARLAAWGLARDGGAPR